MATLDFLEPLEDIIVEHFDILAESYARDTAEKIAERLSATIRSEHGVRFVIVDASGTQLENARVFREYGEALDYLQENDLGACSVATLIFER